LNRSTKVYQKGSRVDSSRVLSELESDLKSGNRFEVDFHLANASRIRPSMNRQEVTPDQFPASSSDRLRTDRWWKRFGRIDFLLPALIVLFTLPVSLKALRSYFTFDDLMNLNYYLQRPWVAIGSNLAVFTSFRRPLGALVYLPLFGIAGMNPEPYYLAGIFLYSINIVLVFRLLLRLSESRFTALVAASLFALHPEVHNVLFNFGGVFELLCLLFLLIATISYVHFARAEVPRPRRYYVLSLLSFLVALNAKETAVVLPVILAAFHLFYAPDFRNGFHGLRRAALWLAPFFAVVVPYTLVKMLGAEAYWRDNALYTYHFDTSVLSNFSHYLGFLSNQEWTFSPAGGIVLLLGAAALGLMLRNGSVLFGLSWAVLGLLPVLPLPRFWGLFLYIPLVGFAFAAAALIADLGRRLVDLCLPTSVRLWRPGRLVVLILAGLYLFRILGAMSPDIDRARRVFYHERNPSWRSFAEQLYSIYPSLQEGTLLVFVNPPFDRESDDRWCLRFLVRLKYGPGIRVARSPDDDARLPALVRAASEVQYLTWDGRVLSVRAGPG
jgi:hypothetical protein